VWSGRRQVQLDPPEVAILALLMTGGSRGVTQDDIIKAGNLDPAGRDVAATLARIRRKTGTKGRGQMVRRERVTLYVFDDDVAAGAPEAAGRRSTRPHVRR
jgi:DNA-binding response OmpR family regulator